MSKKLLVTCAVCGKNKQVYRQRNRDVKNYFCNLECKAVYQSLKNNGVNNSNYGKKWSQDKRENASKRTKERFIERPELKHLAGSANRGVKFDEDRIKRMHSNRTKESYIHPVSEETRQLIGKKSSEKWTIEYRERNRKIREERGQWVKLKDKRDRDIYYNAANWTNSKNPEKDMFNLIRNEECLNLLQKFGKFNPKNPIGVVRDHIFCRWDGFNMGVFPEILRHPCNCQLILHADNIRKRSKRYEDRSDLTLEELFGRIIDYTGTWFEQDLVLQRIQEYKNGNRWTNIYKEESYEHFFHI